jgi:cytoskeletal protein CcmA (bactofilin family)
MNIKMNIIRIILVLGLLLVPTGVVLAQSGGGSVFLVGQNYTLGKGETLYGSIAVMGGNIQIEEEAVVNGSIVVFGGNISIAEDTLTNGDIAVFGGNITISGEVNGDVVIFGGQANLTSTATVFGDVSSIGGQVSQESGSKITGDVNNNAPPVVDVPSVPNVPNVPNAPNVPNVPNVPDPWVSYNPFWEVMSVFGRAVGVALIGMLLALFLQPQLDRVSAAVTHQPLIAGGYGLLAVIVVPVAMLIMTMTIILIPIALLAGLILPLAWIFGMVALGQEVGDRFAKAINQVWAPVLSTGFGTFLLVLVVGFVGLIPCVGWLASFLVTLAALGGVALTWFGTRAAPGGMMNPASVEELPPTS